MVYGLCGAQGIASPAALCEEAAQFASHQTGVPLSILRAVTLAETGNTQASGGGFDAWPWAVMADLKGHWFPDQYTAIAFAEEQITQGKSNVDIGCFQLNIRWHATAFQSVSDMLSPQNNALYAANFLQDLYIKTGDWRAAVGRYHSRDGARAEAYVRRLETIFDRHLGTMAPSFDAPAMVAFADPERAKHRQVYERFGLVSARGPLLQTPSRARPLIGDVP
ncbi:transglycosylase SLT domain-containing protein [Pseudorhodobacter ferrugineus]|nr:transglycosylase SLT domain-containing protein [Pseudorhodobacter ferrugineus]